MPHISTLDWSKHTHIGLDLDETLASTVSGMLEEAHLQNKLIHIKTMDAIHSYDLKSVDPSLDDTSGQEIWESYGKKTLSPTSVALVEWAYEWVSSLLRKQKNLSVVTARSDDGDWKKPRTLDWVTHYFPQIQNIHFVNHFTKESRPKSEICSTYAITLLIDDSIENTRELCESGIAAILLEKPWNRDIDFDHLLLYRAKNWEEIIKSLNK